MSTTPEFPSESRGLLPAGTETTFGRILRTSDTAYEVVRVGHLPTWVSFDALHGRPAPASPLVTFR